MRLMEITVVVKMMVMLITVVVLLLLLQHYDVAASVPSILSCLFSCPLIPSSSASSAGPWRMSSTARASSSWCG